VGWFKRDTPPPETADLLRTLSQRIDDSERVLRGLKTEWLDTLERLERIAGRLAKRAQRAIPGAPADGAPDEGPQMTLGLREVMKRRRQGP
jgi:hypothetical protein